MKKKFLLLMVILCVSLSTIAAAIPASMFGVEVVAYDKTTDYMALMNDAANEGSANAIKIGSIYESQRNLKIENLGLNAEPTSFFKDGSPEQIKKLIYQYNNPAITIKRIYSDTDAAMIAKTLRRECYGMKSTTEMACVVWVILNRVDAGCANGTISGVVSATNQFAYKSSTEVVDPYLWIAYDVLERWQREKNGEVNVGRVLPNNFYAFGGDGTHNFFRLSYRDFSVIWDYSLPSPYAN